MRVTADDYMTTAIIDEAFRVQDELRILMFNFLSRIVTLVNPNTAAGTYTIPYPELINIIERNIDELAKGGYASSDMQPTVEWLGELNDVRRLSHLDVNRWFESVELITNLVYAVSYRGLITGNFSAGNNRTRQNLRSV